MKAKRLKQLLLSFAVMGMVIFMIAGCSLFPGLKKKATIHFIADAIDSSATASNLTRSIDLGGGLILEEYNITFYKIEIGNDYEGRQTIWESTSGEKYNLAGDYEIEMKNVQDVEPGTYNFCRVIIKPEIGISGTYNGTPGETTFPLTGNYNTEVPVGQVGYLFGTEEVNKTGQFVLEKPIVIKEGTKLKFIVDVKDSIEFISGPPARLKATSPTIKFEVVEP